MPLSGRVPGLLALAALTAAAFFKPVFFGLAAGPLAVLGLLPTPAGGRRLAADRPDLKSGRSPA